MENFDVLVIGSGSGLNVANAAANNNRTVAVVERGPLGGTSLHRGDIPSKRLLYHADVLETIERAGEFHIEADVTDVSFSDIVHEVDDEIASHVDQIRHGLQSSALHRLFQGEGRFVDERTVEVSGGEDDGARIRADNVVIAAGTRPTVPDVDGIETVDYLTSPEALWLEEPPEHLVVLGDGYVAAELSHFFGTFGSEVTIVCRGSNLLPETDGEVAEAFTERYADRFAVYTGHEATAVSETDDGTVTVEARPSADGRDDDATDGSGDGVTVSGDALLVADGRTPNSDTLHLDAAGVETDEQGFIKTDEYLRTTAEGVWAHGDVVGEYLSKHSATHEGAVVVQNLFEEELQPVDYTAMPFAVFASPQVAGVGAHEEELQAAGREYATHTQRYDQVPRGSTMKAEGFVKVIIDLDGNLLGCHILGPQAPDLIQEVVVSMEAGTGTVQDIRQSVHVHPALSEVVQEAFSGRFTQRLDIGFR